MKRNLPLFIIGQIFLLLSNYGIAQILPTPKISVYADSGAVSVELHSSIHEAITMSTATTNSNPSIPLNDTSFAIVVDSLHTDRTATIVTVYETDDDNVVGLWQISNAGSPKLWLNSQCASYEDFAIWYRKFNERGVVIHTMVYSYPEPDSLYDGHDTLHIGICDTISGSKNFCAFQYFDTRISARQQRILESALAIRYGAWLHGPYLNSIHDTLWHPLGSDSTFSFGICGIGRDDSISLAQPQSIIRNDILSIAAAAPLPNMAHVMMGRDSNEAAVIPIPVVVAGETFFELGRHWKVRGHGSHQIPITFSADSSYSDCRLSIISGDNTRIIDMNDTVIILEGEDYYISLLVSMDVASSCQKHHTNNDSRDGIMDASIESSVVASPNPTSGSYSVSITQAKEDYVDIRVIDANGRTMETHRTSGMVNEYRYDSSLSAAGIYYIVVRSNGTMQTIKLIVAK